MSLTFLRQRVSQASWAHRHCSILLSILNMERSICSINSTWTKKQMCEGIPQLNFRWNSIAYHFRIVHNSCLRSSHCRFQTIPFRFGLQDIIQLFIWERLDCLMLWQGTLELIQHILYCTKWNVGEVDILTGFNSLHQFGGFFFLAFNIGIGSNEPNFSREVSFLTANDQLVRLRYTQALYQIHSHDTLWFVVEGHKRIILGESHDEGSVFITELLEAAVRATQAEIRFQCCNW